VTWPPEAGDTHLYNRLVSTFGPVRASFRAMATTIVPETETLDENGWNELERIVEEGLASRPPAVRRQLRMLVRLLNVLPLFRFGTTFRNAGRETRTRFFLAIQDAPLLLLRRGFWGLRTLVFMGYYSRDAARAAIGYRAEAGGWKVRR
jgi:hypothetical protein